MKLYYKPGSCSLAVHIALTEAGEDFSIELVDVQTQTTRSGQDYSTINPNGYVPALALSDDEILTEVPAILQYIADQNPNAGLAPAQATLERTRMLQYLSFTASELHKSFSPLFSNTPPEGAARDAVLAKIDRRMGYIEDLLSDGREYLLGRNFSVADLYTFVVATWTAPTNIDLGRWPNVKAFVARMKARPAVRKAMIAEGLIKDAA